jgi:hypothetical protein
MSYVTFHDISYAQGLYNMDADPSPVVEMKMTGYYYGSKTAYTDVQGARNYQDAVRLGKIPLLYHFAGGADPVAEADFFVNNGAAPFANGDIYELDYELTAAMNPPADPDSWCRAFVDRVKARTGVYPLFYTYAALFNEHGGFPKTMEVCSLIIADYAVSPDANVPINHPYIIQQYTDTPLDTNALFIPLDTLRKYAYGYKAPSPAPVPTPVPTPVPPTPPVVVPEPTPVPAPPPVTPPVDVPPTPVPPTPSPAPTPPPVTPIESIWEKFIKWFLALIGVTK